ncbi:HD domain-containing protein [Maritimibacter sp. DP1N21-5]|nr:HD domain-containing protein [Maritimibacter sp. DP1N21-5]
MTDPQRYATVWKRMAPFMAARRNDIHLPLCFSWAQQLCDAYPEADRDICSLAIMLHDIGWYAIDNDRIMEEGFRSEDFMQSDVRYLHEAEGVRMAREILDGTEWQPLTDAVCTIIDGHDTRTDPRDLNDRVVRDADKLWRFGMAGLCVSAEWFQDSVPEYFERITRFLDLLETEKGRELAAAELEATRIALMRHII